MQLCFKIVRFARIAGFDGTVCSQAIIVRYNVLKSTRGLKKMGWKWKEMFLHD